jgi:hypothetical protein
MNATIRHTNKFERVVVERALLREQRLTFGARGLFAFLWDLPTGWKICLRHLASMSPQGITAVRSMLRELEKIGALEVLDKRGERGRMAGKEWMLFPPETWAKEGNLKAD